MKLQNRYQQHSAYFTSNHLKRLQTIATEGLQADLCEKNNVMGIIEYIERRNIESPRPNWYPKLIEFIKGSKVFLEEKTSRIIGKGGLTTVFDIGEGRALKISSENPFEYRKFEPSFDIPLLSDVYEHNGMYGYVQAKADTRSVTIEDVLDVKRRMKKAGYLPSRDFSERRIDQIGIYNGKSYLLDSRCAIRQNNRITRLADWFIKRSNNKKPRNLYPNEIEAEAEYVHESEVPRPNYTTKEALRIIYRSIKDA